MENNNVKKINIDGWDAFVIFDDENNQYTLSYAGEGGAICSDVDLEKAKEKFKTMMLFSVSVQKLVNFGKTGKLEL